MSKVTHVMIVCSVLSLVFVSSLYAGPSETPDLFKLSLEELMGVEVTSVSRQESTVGRSPAAIFVISSEMIRRSGATTIPELFRMVPGMDVARADNNKWAVSARGFNDRFSKNLLVQIDGRTLYNPIFSGVYWDAVDYPLHDIERIEVIRGPGASVWGANAVNGIINIITKSTKDTQGGLISGGAGTEERGFGTFRYGGKAGENVSYRIYGDGFNRDKQFAEADDPNDAWKGGSGGLKLDWQAAQQDAVTFDAGYFNEPSGKNDVRAMSTAPFRFRNLEDEDVVGGHVLGRVRHTLDDDASWVLQMYWDHVDRDSTNDVLNFRWDTFDVDFQRQFPIGERQKFIYGAGYRLIDAFVGPSARDNGFIIDTDLPNRQAQTMSLFAQDEIALIEDRLSLTLGSKLEHNDYTNFEIQPTGRLLWTPTQRQSVWASVSRAVRTPTMLEDNIRITSLQSIAGAGNYPQSVGNVDFKSEEVLAYELGYRSQVTDDLSTDLAVFYNDYDRLRVLVPQTAAPPFLPLLAQNRMSAKTYGVEWSNTWRATKRWQLYGAYTFLNMELKRDKGISFTAEAAEHQSPQNQVYLKSSWDLPHDFEFDLMGRYVSRLSGFNLTGAAGLANYIRAYVSMDARLGWRPGKNWELELVGQNLLDDSHPEFGQSNQGPLVEIQRSVYAKITYKW